MHWHPFAEKFPLLEGDEWEEFKAGIQRTKGIADQPVLFRVVDSKIQGLDGRNRFIACQELKIKPATKKVVVPDEEVIDFILRKNVRRRHMTKELRQTLVAELRAEGESLREIAATLGTSEATVRSDLQNSGAQNCAPEGGKVTGKDGKQYSASKLIPELANMVSQGQITPKLKPELEALNRNQQAAVWEHIKAGVNPRAAVTKAKTVKRQPGDEPKAKRKRKAGKALFDWKILDKHFGPVMRFPEDIARAYPDEKKQWEYGEATKLLVKLAELAKEWKKRLVKK